ncbi:MAG: glycosyltransferase [Candidatus Eisenbacteria bacterium]|nr:glycosyltransferase [Candidatus Eisenbacteria bacterium]
MRQEDDIRERRPATEGVYENARVLLMFPFHNEGPKLRLWADRLLLPVADHVIGVNDGSTDDGPEYLRELGIHVLDQPQSGIGASIKRCVAYARENDFDVLVVMAGNGKDDPAEVPRLVEALLAGADYVQGSRFLPGGSSPNLPLFRLVAIKVLSFLFTLWMRRRCTDLTNGFRAYRLAMLDDPRIDIGQDWLDGYEYEYYVHWKAYELRYTVAEVPVTKRYPDERKVEYTKIRLVRDWWQLLRPFVLLGLRIRK